jgi:hypothetical protein
MARTWISVAGGHAGAWDIPATLFTTFTDLATAAEAAFQFAKEESSPTATARCKEAFGALTAFMRDFKRRYFLSPPLVDSDYIALSLKPHDSIPTPSGAPTAQVTVETFLVGRHELGLKIIYLSGSPEDPANKGYRIWWSVIAHGETPPASPKELRNSFFTMRKKDVKAFEFEDSGKTAYFSVVIENGGKQGQWGPLVSALIP